MTDDKPEGAGGVPRYVADCPPHPVWGVMAPDPLGEWCSAEDVEKLEADLAQAVAERDEATRRGKENARLREALELAVKVEQVALWNRCLDCDTAECQELDDTRCLSAEKAHRWLRRARKALEEKTDA